MSNSFWRKRKPSDNCIRKKQYYCTMRLLIDVISTSVQYAHYKIFEVDTDVYFVHTTTKWKEGLPPNDFYLAKGKYSWETDVPIPEPILDDITVQFEAYLKYRRLEASGATKPGWLY